MSQRRHAASDGSFARSAGSAMGRAIAIVVVAVLVGIFLMSKALDDTSVSVGGDDDGPGGTSTEQTTTTAASTDSSSADTTTPVVQPTLRPPNQVTVLVANASGVDGAAGRMADTLNPKGYIALKGNSALDSPVTLTVVYYADGFQAEAAAVAVEIGVDPSTVKAYPVPITDLVADLQNANVLVILGVDLAKAA